MAPRHRVVVRVALLAFAAVMGLVQGVAVFEAAQSLAGSTTDDRAQRLVALLGTSLKAAGLTGLYVAFAIGLRDWSTLFGPSAAGLRSPAGLRRARRQIAGTAPFAPAEVPGLRRLARWRVDALRPARWMRWAGACTLAFMLGIGLQPPFQVLGPRWSVADRVIQVLVVVVLVVYCWSRVHARRGDDEAEVFLARTSALGSPDHEDER